MHAVGQRFPGLKEKESNTASLHLYFKEPNNRMHLQITHVTYFMENRNGNMIRYAYKE